MRYLILLPLLYVSLGVASADESSHEQAARRLLEVSRSAQVIDTVYDTVETQIAGMAEQMGITDDLRPVFDRHMERVFRILREELSWEKMEPYMVDAYVQVYTEQELSELIEFYESPIGQKFLDKMPEVMAKSMELTQSMMGGFYERFGELQGQLEADIKAIKAGEASDASKASKASKTNSD